MSGHSYRGHDPADPTDAMIVIGSGAEPAFDTVLEDFLLAGYESLKARAAEESLLEFASLGRRVPWLYRLTFSSRGLCRRGDGEVNTHHRHVVALRFLPDYLRRADRFAMLRLVEPKVDVWHPNISPEGAICVEIYPGESLLEICHSLHDLFRWRLRQYDDRDALNPAACAWGRQHVNEPIDDRPLFGPRPSIRWQSSE